MRPLGRWRALRPEASPNEPEGGGGQTSETGLGGHPGTGFKSAWLGWPWGASVGGLGWAPTGEARWLQGGALGATGAITPHNYV